MKRLWCIVLVLSPISAARAESDALAQARHLWLRGHYHEAQARYESLRSNPALRVGAAIGVSQCQESVGDYDQALAAVDAALTIDPKSADLHARRAKLLFFRGRWEDAQKAVAQALERDGEHFQARWVRAQLQEARGNLTQADAEYRWFVRTYTARNDANRDIRNPDELLLVGRAGCVNARWNRLSDQFQFVVNEIYGEAVRLDPDFWFAEYEAGKLFLEKYNRADALAALDRAVAVNPSAAEALVGKGIAALQQYELRRADEFADQALKINPNHPEALCLKADLELLAGRMDKARGYVEHAQRICPADETVLGRTGAILWLEGSQKAFAALCREIEQRDKKPGVFYLELAQQLEERGRYDQAAGFYDKAIQLRPMLSDATAGLGILYLRMGKEPEGRALLERAFEADTFNVRVSNLLVVLRHLDKYQTERTAHFVVRFDPKTDGAMIRPFLRCLDETYSALAECYHFQLPQPILVELFNRHDMFSGRMVGLPDLHTVGASTGRMFAMASPHAEGVTHVFNWARVVRHELVHVFNQEQSHFQVPHWLTEGLAVANEGFTRPQEWMQILATAALEDQLLNLGNIDLAFVRPESSRQWTLAYCQANLYVEYLSQRCGADSIGRLLAAYGDGLNTHAAIQRACGVDQSAFDGGYREYVRKLIASAHIAALRTTAGLRELQHRQRTNPEDVDTMVQLAEQLELRGRDEEARQMVELALRKRPGSPAAVACKARILIKADDLPGAQLLLEGVLERENPVPRVLDGLGDVYLGRQDLARAAEIFELGRKVQPYENKWLGRLADLYRRMGDKDRQIAVLKQLVLTDPDDVATRKQLVTLLLETRQWPGAEKYARGILEIDVGDLTGQRALGDALLNEGKLDAAIKTYRAILQENSGELNIRVKLAQAYVERGNLPQAELEISRVLAAEPDNVEAKAIRDRLMR